MCDLLSYIDAKNDLSRVKWPIRIVDFNTKESIDLFLIFEEKPQFIFLG